ncbi:hypothetical protein OH76DRAFT_699926 [Lentinus brumalis]|uniref:F-box domain-containing protein n=1 Tax=Lentinus brumalis TaxID=2498619 RepID=A0A371D6H5_9APHY|nr:hypothetical protein OH76DRAFT_699926 [Polyporus brumalis]
MPRYLPGELTDRIISLVLGSTDGSDYNGYQALLSCALVCQAWLPASRSALSDCIRIDCRAAYDSFVQSVLPSEQWLPYLQSTRVLWIDQSSYELRSNIRDSESCHGRIVSSMTPQVTSRT